ASAPPAPGTSHATQPLTDTLQPCRSTPLTPAFALRHSSSPAPLSPCPAPLLLTPAISGSAQASFRSSPLRTARCRTLSTCSVHLRFATGLPTLISVCPVYLYRSTLNAASRLINIVAPSLRLSCFSFFVSSSLNLSDSVPPGWRCTAGRGLSVGSSSTCRLPP